MKEVEVKLNKSGIISLLKSEEVSGTVRKIAEKEGEIDREFIGIDRYHAFVKKEGRKDD
ncbi:MAG: hypothetical protein IKO32_00430 [Lachnospiraceae bacterium]|nr:hypothetical protein [Lachnospiraceae bacterium]